MPKKSQALASGSASNRGRLKSRYQVGRKPNSASNEVQAPSAATPRPRDDSLTSVASPNEIAILLLLCSTAERQQMATGLLSYEDLAARYRMRITVPPLQNIVGATIRNLETEGAERIHEIDDPCWHRIDQAYQQPLPSKTEWHLFQMEGQKLRATLLGLMEENRHLRNAKDVALKDALIERGVAQALKARLALVEGANCRLAVENHLLRNHLAQSSSGQILNSNALRSRVRRDEETEHRSLQTQHGSAAQDATAATLPLHVSTARFSEISDAPTSTVPLVEHPRALEMGEVEGENTSALPLAVVRRLRQIFNDEEKDALLAKAVTIEELAVKKIDHLETEIAELRERLACMKDA